MSLVALNRRLGCLDPNLPKDSPQVKMIDSVNNMFEALHHTEMDPPLWRLFETKPYKMLKSSHSLIFE